MGYRVDISRLMTCSTHRDSKFVNMLNKYKGDPVEQVKTINFWAATGLITPTQKERFYDLIGE